METDPNKTVSFSGHRSFKMASGQGNLFGDQPANSESLVSRTEDELAMLCSDGYDTFLCGMAEGFDLAAAEAVVNLRAKYPGIRLIAVIPHPGQARFFGHEAQEKYVALLSHADEAVILSETYTADCFHRRNDFLLEHSSVLVCYYNGAKGGTAYTVKQALKRGIRVINIF